MLSRYAHKVVETREEWCEEDRTGAVEPAHLRKVRSTAKATQRNAKLKAEKQTAN